MKTKFALIVTLKKWLNLLLVTLFVYCAFTLLKSNVYRFNPQYLVENSILKDKNFSAEVKELTSQKLKVKAYVYEEHSNPIVSVNFSFQHAGSAYDPENLQGTSLLLSDLLTSGAGPYNMKSFHEILERKAIQMSFDADADEFFGSLLFIKKDMKEAARLLNLALTKPRFEATELQKAITLRETALKRKMEQPKTFLYIEALKKIYGSHPYGRNPYGNLNHYKKITAEQLRRFLKTHLALDNIIVGISGDITENEAQELIDDMFKNLPRRRTGKILADVTVDFSAPQEHIQKTSKQNTGLFMAAGPHRRSKDFYPMVIAMQILAGGSLNSRVHKQAREKEGLTYGAYGSLGHNDKVNFIRGEYSSTPENFSRLQEIISNEWRNIGEFGVTESEFEQNKNYLIAADALRYADIDNISATLVYMQKMSLGSDFLQKRNDYIRDVTLEDVNEAAQKYFTTKNLRFITIGEKEIIGDDEKK